MTSHEWANELTKIYTMAHHLRKKAIADGVTSFNVDVRACMDIVIARLDMLNRNLGYEITNENKEK